MSLPELDVPFGSYGDALVGPFGGVPFGPLPLDPSFDCPSCGLAGVPCRAGSYPSVPFPVGQTFLKIGLREFVSQNCLAYKLS